MTGLKTAVGVTVGLFATGVAVGVMANQRGIPQDQIGRWFVKGVTRRALHTIDALRDLLPDEQGVPVDEALGEEPLDPAIL